MDVVVCLAVLPAALPLLAVLAALIRLESPGPIFDARSRTGLGGRPFRTWRLRSTVAAGDGAAEHLTAVGRFLRRTHLDVLPELFSVLRGDMSLVGPRPDPAGAESLPLWYTGRFEAKPGITGLAQISRAAALDPEEAVRLDLAYVRTWSPGLDVRILARSVAIALDDGTARARRMARRVAALLEPLDRAVPSPPVLSVPRLAVGALVIADVAAAGLALALAYALRFGLQLGDRTVTDPPPGEYFKLYVVIAAAVVVIATLQQLYRTTSPYSRLEESSAVARTVTLGTVLALAATFFYRDFNFSRLAMIYFWVAAVGMMATAHALLRSWLVRRHARGLDLSPTVVVGSPSAHLLDRLQNDPAFGLDLIGCLAPRPDPCASTPSDDAPGLAGVLLGSARMGLEAAPGRLAHLGPIDDVGEILASARPERVIIVEHGLTHAQLLETIDACEQHGIRVQLIPPIYDLLIDPTDLTFVNGVPALRIDEVRSRVAYSAIKRTVDIALSALLLLFLAPLLLWIAAMIRRTSPGPVLFRQTRGGRNGRPFQMLKFRTMVCDAEERLGSVIDMDRLDQPAFKVVDDPRVTPVGRWLRRFSLDELPQLINVLKGEMTLVGPRPEELRLVEKYDVWQRRRLKMKPGITGLQQVVARGSLADLARRVQLDVYYTRKQSLLLDLSILVRTVGAVLSGRGAT